MKHSADTNQELPSFLLAADRQLLSNLVNLHLESGNIPELLSLLNKEARATGMSHISKISGTTREALYKALRPGSKLQLNTFLGVLHALGLELKLETITDSDD